MGGYAAEYVAYLRLYRAGKYYECHEVLEVLWLRTRDDFYKGMIQVAVALYQLQRGNLVGARKMLYFSQAYLRPFAPHYHGTDVGALLRQLAARFTSVRQAMEGLVAPPDPARVAPFQLGLDADLSLAAGWELGRRNSRHRNETVG